MGSTELSSLSTEFLRLILARLSALSIVQLFLTGNKRLMTLLIRSMQHVVIDAPVDRRLLLLEHFSNLRSIVINTAPSPAIEDLLTCLPPDIVALTTPVASPDFATLASFSQLQELEIHLPINQSIEDKLALLPKTLKSLHLSDLRYDNFDLRLFQLPKLKVLGIKMAHLLSFRHVTESAYQTSHLTELNTLSLHIMTKFPASQLKLLPPTLTSLRLSSTLEDENAIRALPPGLTSLQCPMRNVSLIPALPCGLTHLSSFVETDSRLSADLAASLPPSLVKFTMYNIQMDAAALSVLPKSITHLHIRLITANSQSTASEDAADTQAAYQFPPALKHLSCNQIPESGPIISLTPPLEYFTSMISLGTLLERRISFPTTLHTLLLDIIHPRGPLPKEVEDDVALRCSPESSEEVDYFFPRQLRHLRLTFYTDAWCLPLCITPHLVTLSLSQNNSIPGTWSMLPPSLTELDLHFSIDEAWVDHLKLPNLIRLRLFSAPLFSYDNFSRLPPRLVHLHAVISPLKDPKRMTFTGLKELEHLELSATEEARMIVEHDWASKLPPSLTYFKFLGKEMDLDDIRSS